MTQSPRIALLKYLAGPRGSVDWIRTLWDEFESWPGGKRAYSSLLGKLIPYTGSIPAEFKELGPGVAKVKLRKAKHTQNHLGSVHAIALSNLAELAGNAALAYSLPKDSRFIVKSMNTNYLKKARGVIVAHAECPIPDDNQRQDCVVRIKMLDELGVEVANAELVTLIGPAT